MPVAALQAAPLQSTEATTRQVVAGGSPETSHAVAESGSATVVTRALRWAKAVLSQTRVGFKRALSTSSLSEPSSAHNSESPGKMGIRRLQGTEVCGTISEDTTWTLANSPYVVTCDVTIASGVTLTIEPGVVVKFEYRSSPDEKRCLTVGGVLNAQGTAGDPIVFTSIRDDSHAGDTNGDGAATTANPGDWGYIRFNAAGSTLDHCVIRYGGRRWYTDDFMVWVNGVYPSMAIRNCQIEHAHQAGLYYRASSTYDSSFSLEANTFANNPYGAWLVGSSTTSYAIDLTGNTFSGNSYPVLLENSFPTYSGNSFAGDSNEGIAVRGTWNVNGTWTDVQGLGLPYIIESDTTIASGAALTIEPGVVVKFEYRSSSDEKRCLTVGGVLNAQGTAGDPIVFTSIRDDSYAGDTNGDGAATTANPGDWGHIRFNAAGSTLDHCVIRYGGRRWYTDDFMVWVNGVYPSMAIRNCQIEHAHQAGLYYRASSTYDSSFSLEANTFANNPYGAWLVGSSTTSYAIDLTGNTFSGNSYPVLLENSFPTYSGNSFAGDSNEGIAVRGTWNVNGTWTDVQGLGLPYIIESDTTIASGAALTIEPGVVVKFEYRSSSDEKRCLTVGGVLNAQGTAGDPIVFTSIRDDSYAGDTNGDGAATTANPGDWGYIRFNAAGSTLDHCVIRYGGRRWYTDDFMVWVNGVSATIQHALLEYSHGDALYIYRGVDSPNMTVEYCTFRNNNTGIHVAGP